MRFDFTKSKRIIFWFIVFVLGAITVSIFVSPTITINGNPENLEIIPKLLLMTCLWGFSLVFYYLFYHRLSLSITKRSDGTLEIDKKDWFFTGSHATLLPDQNPRLIARRRRMVGTTVYVPTVYQPLIRYQTDTIDSEINLVFSASYLMKGIGPRAVFKKEEMEIISSNIGLPLIIEE